MGEIASGSYNELKKIIDIYSKFLPRGSYPWIMMIIASCCTFFSWFGGKYLFPTATLLPRMFYSWLIAAIQYAFLLPGIGGSVEVLGMSQNALAIIVHAIQLIVYLVMNKFTTKFELTRKHIVAFVLMTIAVIIVAYY